MDFTRLINAPKKTKPTKMSPKGSKNPTNVTARKNLAELYPPIVWNEEGDHERDLWAPKKPSPGETVQRANSNDSHEAGQPSTPTSSVSNRDVPLRQRITKRRLFDPEDTDASPPKKISETESSGL